MLAAWVISVFYLVIGLLGVVFRRRADKLSVWLAALNPTFKWMGDDWEVVARRLGLVLSIGMVVMGGGVLVFLLRGGTFS